MFRTISMVLILIVVLTGCFENKEMKELKSRNIPFSSNSFVDNAVAGNTEVVSLFVKAGIKINEADSLGRVALWEAKKADNSEVVALLIGAGANYKSILPILIKEIKNPEATIRYKSLNILKSLGPSASDAVPVLADTINTPTDYSETVIIIQVLKAIGTTAAVSAASQFENKLSQQKAILIKKQNNLEKQLLKLINDAYACQQMANSSSTTRRFAEMYGRGVENNLREFRKKAVEYERVFGRNNLISFVQKYHIEQYLSQ